ncbi:MAG TPA: cold-shock protein [Bacteroidia bacterium]|nr:cold-shock protein [Bacteroidia bacterium]HNT80543.1 cold-shock protein [Bacteroidia bacterium]
MGRKSNESYLKKKKADKKKKKRDAKFQKKIEKKNKSKNGSPDDMISHVDDFGNIISPPSEQDEAEEDLPKDSK